jgi:hypothetical protein
MKHVGENFLVTTNKDKFISKQEILKDTSTMTKIAVTDKYQVSTINVLCMALH